MTKKTHNICETDRITYPELRGMDLTGGGGFAYLENMYVDYEGSGGAVESIVGFRRIRSLKDGIHSLTLIGDGEAGQLLIHSGSILYRMPVSERDKKLPLSEVASLEDSESIALPFGSLCFITDGKKLLCVTHSGKVSLVSEESGIVGCSCGAIYDGRLFLAGNPDCPDRVFYSSPIGEGEMSFPGSFTEGVGDLNIRALISLDGYLWIFRTSKRGDGDIICRKAASGESYPTVRVVDKLPVRSRAVVFNRELLFMSPDGLMAIEAPTADGEIKLCCRSAKINRMLLREDICKADFGVWMGYLVISFGDRLYLADPRGNSGYDWYFISGVGGYKNDRRVYRYRKDAEEGCESHPRAGEAAMGEIYSRGVEGGSLIYYSKEGSKCYSVYPTAELYGGEFIPAKELLCCGRFMWFATEEGGLYIFNNDKRGLSPDGIPYSEGSDAGDAALSDEAIHPLYYSFAGHAPSYIAITHPVESEQCGREVSRLGRTLKIGLKPLSRGKIRLLDIADGEVVSERGVCADKCRRRDENTQKTDPGGYNFTTVSLPERAAGAERKQLCLKTDGFASPFGISYIAHRHKK